MEQGDRTCKEGRDDLWGTSNPRDTRIQIYISIALGVLAFLTFCVSHLEAEPEIGC
jgi:hypothetical protein